MKLYNAVLTQGTLAAFKQGLVRLGVIKILTDQDAVNAGVPNNTVQAIHPNVWDEIGEAVATWKKDKDGNAVRDTYRKKGNQNAYHVNLLTDVDLLSDTALRNNKNTYFIIATQADVTAGRAKAVGDVMTDPVPTRVFL